MWLDKSLVRVRTQFDSDAEIRLLSLLEEDPRRVFYARQLTILLESGEKPVFHWVTERAIETLNEAKLARVWSEPMVFGQDMKFVTHRSNRDARLATRRVKALVEAYSDRDVTESVGQQGELLAIEGVARLGARLCGRNVREHAGRVWTASNHDLDFVFELDGLAYGAEVKNTLGYPEKIDIQLKVQICKALGVSPVIIARKLPGTTIVGLHAEGGFGWLMDWQMYPAACRKLVEACKAELSLPMSCARCYSDGTLERFRKHHAKRVDFWKNPQ